MMRKVPVVILASVLVLAVVCTSCLFKSGEEKVPVTVEDIFWNTSLPGVVVQLHPEKETEAERNYTVELYERGELRTTTSITWSLSELNSSMTKQANFPLTRQEDQDYQYRTEEQLKEVFTVKVLK